MAPGGLDPAGGQRIDTNLRSQAERQAAGERHDGALGCRKEFAGISLHARLGLVPAHRQNRAMSAGFHPSADLSAKANGRRHVDRPEEIELGIERQPSVRAGQCVGPGDLEPGIQSIPDVPGLVHEPVAGDPAGQVGHDTLRADPARPQVACQVFSSLHLCVAVDDHIGTGLGQCDGHGASDARGGTENGRAAHAMRKSREELSWSRRFR